MACAMGHKLPPLQNHAHKTWTEWNAWGYAFSGGKGLGVAALG